MKKQDPDFLAVGLFDKDKMVIGLGMRECPVKSRSFTKWITKNYGSGGWIEGTERVQVTYEILDVYHEGELIGYIDKYNVMFRDPNRYKVILNKPYREIFPKLINQPAT